MIEFGIQTKGIKNKKNIKYHPASLRFFVHIVRECGFYFFGGVY